MAHKIEVILLVMAVWTLLAALVALAIAPLFRRESWLFGFLVPKNFTPDSERLFGFDVPARYRRA